MGKKNLDKLFQEKFQHFEEIPDEKVWDAISASLDKKKSRKLIPFWWKLGGIAALLAILFTIFNPFEDKNIIAPVITDTENENRVDKEDEVIIQFEETSEEADQVTDSNYDKSNGTSNSFKEQEVDTFKTPREGKKSNFSSPKPDQTKTSQLAISDATKPIQKNESKAMAQNTQASENDIESNDVVVVIDEAKSEKNRLNLAAGETGQILSTEKSSEEGVAEVAQEERKEELSDISNKKSIFDEIDKQNEDEEAVASDSKNKWSVGANLAPVYFSSFGEGSPIDPAFMANSKSGDFNMSYGLSIAYGVSNKLSIRTGINKVEYGYDTNEVEFSASVQGSLSDRLNNVNYTQSSENVLVESKANSGFALAENKGSEDVITKEISRNGIMAQEFGYIEVPVELDYALVNNRFGVNLVGGLSTMFLTNNAVVLNDSNETIELGEANNLNSINFSTNVGFGLNYKFTPKVRLNVEPVFKYQLNTFSETSGSVNPFSIGVYSGLNFRF
jgi:hypothetical protein